VANGQSASQLQRRLRRAGLPDFPEHRQSATTLQEADRAAPHQRHPSDASATCPRAARTHPRRPPGARSIRDPATRDTDHEHASADQHPRALRQTAIRNRLERPERCPPRAGIAETFVRSAELRKRLINPALRRKFLFFVFFRILISALRFDELHPRHRANRS